MRLLLALLLLAFAAAAEARGPREMNEIAAGKPFSIRPDRAYILFRTVRPEGVTGVEPVFLRIPSAAEMARHRAARLEAFRLAEPGLIRKREAALRKKSEAEAAGQPFKGEIPPVPTLETFNFVYDEVSNVQRINNNFPFVNARPEITFLFEAVPGDYVLYGLNYGSGALRPNLFACMCLGTVGFSAPAGVVTDLGYFMGDRVHKKSPLPELESDLGPSSTAIFFPLGATVRPVRPDSSVPEALRGATIRPADYRAIGRFVEPRAVTINRLAPVPGVLAYEGRRVIDVKTGADAPSPR
jgi:hypothetical protein